MALLSPQALLVTGVQATYSAVSASDTITADGTKRYVLHVKNGGGSPDSVVIVIPGTDAFGQARPDVTVSVTNGTEKFINLILPDQAADPATGLITVTHSFTTSVTQALLSIA